MAGRIIAKVDFGDPIALLTLEGILTVSTDQENHLLF